MTIIFDLVDSSDIVLLQDIAKKFVDPIQEDKPQTGTEASSTCSGIRCSNCETIKSADGYADIIYYIQPTCLLCEKTKLIDENIRLASIVAKQKITIEILKGAKVPAPPITYDKDKDNPL